MTYYMIQDPKCLCQKTNMDVMFCQVTKKESTDILILEIT